MIQDELEQLVGKYTRLSQDSEYANYDESIAYDRFAFFLEHYPHHSALSESDDEESLWEHFKEVEEEFGYNWREVDLPE